jgi:hypothetical protein
MDHVNLQIIAREHIRDPLNTWPQHIKRHRITLLGEWLFDYDCLRCWMERLETDRLNTQKEVQA